MNTSQRTFSGGELAPSLYARTDQSKYQAGCRTLRNFWVMKSGGATNRPGMEFVAEVKDSTKTVRLIPFVFNADQAYALEFGDRYLRWHQDGAPIEVSGVSAWADATAYALADLVTNGGVTYYCTLAHTSAAATDAPGTGSAWQTNWYALTGSIYEIPTPYAYTDLPSVQYVQSADVVTLVHPSYPPYELKRLGQTEWTLEAIDFGPDIDAPTGLALSGGVAGDVWYAVTAIDATSGEESLATIITANNRLPDPATPTLVTWALVPNALMYNIYRSTDGLTYGLVGATGGVLGGVTTTDTSWVTTTSSIGTNTRNAWVAASDEASNQVVTVATNKALDGRYLVSVNVSVTAVDLGTTPTTTQGRVRAYYSRDSEPRVDAGIIYTSAVIYGAGSISAFPVVDAPVVVPDNGYTTLTIELVAEVFGTAPGDVLAFMCGVDATSGQIEWSNGGTQFSDVNDAADFTRTPPVQIVDFDSENNYPSAVTYYQQRRAFGNTNAEPEKVWASVTGHYQSFARSTPLQDDDAVAFTIAGRQVNAVRHLVDLGKLITFTSGGESIIDGDSNGVLTPSGVNVRQYSYNGTGTLAPLPVDATLLYVQARGSIVRDLSGNTIDGVTGSDLTVWSSHLFKGYTIVDWAFALNPDGIVWAVRSDGTLLGLSYMREQQILGWHRHDTDGLVENVCVIPEGNEDRVYLVVKRTIDGSTKRYVERLASRFITDIRDAVFMDSALTYDGRNTGATTMTLSGGSAWDATEQLTCTASAATFVSTNVNDRVDFTAADGSQLRCTIEGYTSSTVVTVRPSGDVPSDLQSTATTSWALAVNTITGLEHLEGKAVAILGDGYVMDSPNNEDYEDEDGNHITVSSGAVTLDGPYAVVHVGLPYLSDLQTLDIDTASGSSLKEKRHLITKVGLFLEASRGVWVGGDAPSDDDTDPLENLYELRPRSGEEHESPADLYTESVDVLMANCFNDHGRVFVRQVDPLPLSILSVTPTGLIGSP